MTYAEKLKDPRWQKLRLEIFERDNWTCTACQNKEQTLCVHHKKYTATEPWDEPKEHLSTLCDDCHEAIRRFASIRHAVRGADYGGTGQSLAVIQRACAMYSAWLQHFNGSHTAIALQLLAQTQLQDGKENPFADPEGHVMGNKVERT